MRDTPEQCPLCQSTEEFVARDEFTHEFYLIDCSVCGRFSISREAVIDRILEDGRAMLRVPRAVLSHRIRSETGAGHAPPRLTEEWLEEFLRTEPRLPSVDEQMHNLIRLIGDHVLATGEPLQEAPRWIGAFTGALSVDYAFKLAREMVLGGLLTAVDAGSSESRYELMELDLTSRGWQQYEQERTGKVQGNYGFIALKFGDEVLDPFLREVIKPAVASLGYQLFDMRDVAEAGVIDNLLRVRIRDAAFVLVDLTHDNAGAYWEAGYAEGLGKPVLYLCERSKFESARTHFDTNHCTTVPWEASEAARFETDLIATLRRSLNLF